jgi:hypothetical protein
LFVWLQVVPLLHWSNGASDMLIISVPVIEGPRLPSMMQLFWFCWNKVVNIHFYIRRMCYGYFADTFWRLDMLLSFCTVGTLLILQLILSRVWCVDLPMNNYVGEVSNHFADPFLMIPYLNASSRPTT